MTSGLSERAPAAAGCDSDGPISSSLVVLLVTSTHGIRDFTKISKSGGGTAAGLSSDPVLMTA
jgi:hypothetical protein